MTFVSDVYVLHYRKQTFQTSPILYVPFKANSMQRIEANAIRGSDSITSMSHIVKLIVQMPRPQVKAMKALA